MTTKNIQDVVAKRVEELFQYYDDIDCAVTVDQRITAKEQAALWLTRILTQHHQDLMSEVVEKFESKATLTENEVEGAYGEPEDASFYRIYKGEFQTIIKSLSK